MDVYSQGAQLASMQITRAFSTSFSSAITLFSKDIQQDIYNIYGLVRVADEVVDTYCGADADKVLALLEQEVYSALNRNFSANIIVHAFCQTAQQYRIDPTLIAPFFESMRMDLTKKSYKANEYDQYIYGSAEVVGLMCLKIFTANDETSYKQLQKGACALGSAFQKVNFLRDIKDDYETRGRYYFPEGSFEAFDDKQKNKIITDIEADFKVAKTAISRLPDSARFATRLAFDYYNELLNILKKTSAANIKQHRVSVSRTTKLRLLARAKLYGK